MSTAIGAILMFVMILTCMAASFVVNYDFKNHTMNKNHFWIATGCFFAGSIVGLILGAL